MMSDESECSSFITASFIIYFESQVNMKTGASDVRVALVTGAGRGIGRGIALALAERGWAVVINYRGNAEAALETAQAVEAAGGRALLVQADVAQTADRERLLADSLAAFGRIDLLVNNAGMGPATARRSP